MHKVIIIIASLLVITATCKRPTPIVLWHGMGDCCCNPFSLGILILRLKFALPLVHVHSIKIGSSLIADTINGFLMHPDKQIEIACNKIRADPLLRNGYNAIGFSQGAQFLRALAQRCPEPKMKTLVSMAGQHQGVYGLPRCDASRFKFCDFVRRVASKLLYSRFVQKILVQATYWHDPIDEQSYLNSNTFLVDTNNENSINETYIKNLQSLNKIIFVKFENDSMVQPKETEWFGFYKPGQSVATESLQQSRVYSRLGLDKMDKEGKLHFISTPGDHLRFKWQWFKENIIDRYLK